MSKTKLECYKNMYEGDLYVTYIQKYINIEGEKCVQHQQLIKSRGNFRVKTRKWRRRRAKRTFNRCWYVSCAKHYWCNIYILCFPRESLEEEIVDLVKWYVVYKLPFYISITCSFCTYIHRLPVIMQILIDYSLGYAKLL